MLYFTYEDYTSAKQHHIAMRMQGTLFSVEICTQYAKTAQGSSQLKDKMQMRFQ
jgi:hypothetical protein